MNNKSNKKNKSLQKGLFFAISSELEKAIGRKADWAAGAEINGDDDEAQSAAKRKRYADRFGSGEVSDSEFEEDQKKPVKYIPKPGDSPQAVRTKDELEELRTNAKLTRDQTYGTKGKEPKRANEVQEVKDKFREGKNLDTKEGRDKLTPDEKKEYAEKIKEQYTPEKKKQRADESAEDRVWRNLRGGMTAESFEDPEDQEAYKRLNERFMATAGKNAKDINEKAKGEPPAKYGDPARTGNEYSSDRRDRVRIVRPDADPKPADRTPPADRADDASDDFEDLRPTDFDQYGDGSGKTKTFQELGPKESGGTLLNIPGGNRVSERAAQDKADARAIIQGKEDAEARVRRGPKVTVDPKRPSNEEVVARFNDLRDRGVLTRRDEADRLRLAGDHPEIAEERDRVRLAAGKRTFADIMDDRDTPAGGWRGSSREELMAGAKGERKYAASARRAARYNRAIVRTNPNWFRTAPSSSDAGPWAPRSASVLSAGISSNQFDRNSDAVKRTRQGLPTETPRLSGPTAEEEEESVARRGSERLALRPSTSRRERPPSSDTGPYAPRSASVLSAGISSNQFDRNSGAVKRTRQGLPTETPRLSGPTASGLSRISQVIQSDQTSRGGRVDVPTEGAGSRAEELTGRYQAGKLSDAAAAMAGRMAGAKRANDDAWTTRAQTDPRAARLLQHQQVVASKTAADAARPQFAHGLQDIHAAFLGGASLDEVGKMTRQQKSLRNIERDANRLSKAVNKSFKKKH